MLSWKRTTRCSLKWRRAKIAKIDIMLKKSLVRFAVPVAVLSLALTACGSDGQEPVEAPQDDTHASVAPEPTAVQSAVQRGSQRANSLGFDKAQSATAEELAELRNSEIPQADSVHPDTCAETLTAINSSPVQLSADAARVDFGSDNYTGTGTVESATLGEEQADEWLTTYTAAVDQLTGDCSEVEMVVAGQKYSFTSTTAESDTADAVLTWVRKPLLTGSKSSSESGTISSQVLVAKDGDRLNLVSFIGEEASTSNEFTQIGEQILGSMEEEK